MSANLSSQAAEDLRLLKRLPMTIFRPTHAAYVQPQTVDEDARITRLVRMGVINRAPATPSLRVGMLLQLTLTPLGQSMLNRLQAGR